MTYAEARVDWIKQIDGWRAPLAGETAVYWPDIDCTDILRTSSISDQCREKLFGEYHNANNEWFAPEVTEHAVK